MTLTLPLFSAALIIITICLFIFNNELAIVDAKFESPYLFFCKHRLTENQFRFVGLYQHQLVTVDKGKRLIELLYKSIEKDEKNPYNRDGGYKVLQNDDTRMQEIDDLLFKDPDIKNFRKEFRMRNVEAFGCVHDFEMQACGRALMEDLDTGNARRPNVNAMKDLHNVMSPEDMKEMIMGKEGDSDTAPVPADIAEQDDDNEEEESMKFNKDNRGRSFSHDHDGYGGEHSSSISASTVGRASDIEARKKKAEAYRQQHGINPRAANLQKHATEHFRRHQEAKREHFKYQDQVLNQRKDMINDRKHGAELRRQAPDNLLQQQHNNAVRQMQQQQDDKQTFDHMNRHFQHHHTQVEAAQKRFITEENEKARMRNEERIREHNRNIAHDKLGLFPPKKNSKQQQQQQQQGARPKNPRKSENRQNRFEDDDDTNIRSHNRKKSPGSSSSSDGSSNNNNNPRRLHDDKRNGGSDDFKLHRHADPLNEGGYERVVAGLQPIPYEKFCKHKLHFVDYRFVKLYAHNLLQFRAGERFAKAIQNCKHHDEHQEIRCGDDAATRATVLELLSDPEIEVERKKLHLKSRSGFDCVHEFEKAVSVDHKDQEWHLPIEEAVPEENTYDGDDDKNSEQAYKDNIDFFHRIQEEPLHPHEYHH